MAGADAQRQLAAMRLQLQQATTQSNAMREQLERVEQERKAQRLAQIRDMRATIAELTAIVATQKTFEMKLVSVL